MNLSCFLTGFFYGCAAMTSFGVIACIVVGYMESRGKLKPGSVTCRTCGKGQDCGCRWS